MLRKLFTPDIEGVKSIRSVGPMSEKILFCFRTLLVRFIHAESKLATIHLCRLYGKNQIVIFFDG